MPSIPRESSRGTQPSECWCFSTQRPRKRTPCSVPFASNPSGQDSAGRIPAARMACRWALAMALRLSSQPADPQGSGPKTRRETSQGRMPWPSRNSCAPRSSGGIRFWRPSGFKIGGAWRSVEPFSILNSFREHAFALAIHTHSATSTLTPACSTARRKSGAASASVTRVVS